MKLVIFSVEEANQLLDEIRPRMQRLVKAKRHFDHLQARVDLLKVITEGAAEGNSDLRELTEARKRQRAYAEMISEGVQAVHRRGCLIKDLDRGLVDFYALSGDQLVFLCWQLGEAEVSHWHTLEGGFTSRRPLDPSDHRERPDRSDFGHD